MVRGGTLRPLPDAGGLRHAQLAGAAARQDRAARGPADGRLRHLRDRRHRPRRARSDAASGPRSDALRCARHQRAADDRCAQHPSARIGRGERHAGARRRHLERDPAGGGAARHGAQLRPGDPGPDRAAHGRDRRRHRRHVRDDRDAALRAPLSGDHQHAHGNAARARRGDARSSAPIKSTPIQHRPWARKTSRSC